MVAEVGNRNVNTLIMAPTVCRHNLLNKKCNENNNETNNETNNEINNEINNKINNKINNRNAITARIVLLVRPVRCPEQAAAMKAIPATNNPWRTKQSPEII